MEMIYNMHHQEKVQSQPMSKNAKTTRTAIYLISSLFYSIIFFTITIVGITLGVGTIIIWIGLPILALSFAALHGMAAIERSMVRDLLHIYIPSPVRDNTHRNWWQRSLALIKDPLSWKAMLYMLFIKLPMGIINFSVTITLLATVVALLLAPLGYIIPTAILSSLGIHLENTYNQNLVWLQYIHMITFNITGTFEVFEFIKSFIHIFVGILLWFPIRAAILGLGRLSGEITRAMLSPTDDNFHMHTQQQTQYGHMAEQQTQTYYPRD